MKGLLLLAIALAAFMLLFGCTGPQPTNPQSLQPMFPVNNSSSSPQLSTAEQQVRNCESISGNREILQCYEAIFQESPLGPGVCEATGVKTAREACYVAYAATSNDVAGICTTNREAADQDECFYAFGVQNKNAADCDKIQNDVMRGGCYGTVAASAGGSALCEEKGKNSSTVRDYCYALLGGMALDSAMCDKIQNETVRSSCKRYIPNAGGRQQTGTVDQNVTPPIPQNQTQPTEHAGTQAGGCTSPYNGIWTGTVSGTGVYYDSGNYESNTPYSVSYDLEITLKCNESDMTEYGKITYLDITHMQASDPYFGCTGGCNPTRHGTNEIGGINNYASLPEPGGSAGSSMNVLFPNSAVIDAGSLSLSSDGKTITVDEGADSAISTGYSSGLIPNANIAESLEYAHCNGCESTQGVNTRSRHIELHEVS